MTSRRRVAAILCVLMAASLPAAHAEGPGENPGIPLRLDKSNLEFRLGAQRVTGGYGDWREGGVVGTYLRGDHVLRGELASMRRFNESGSYVGLMDTVTLGRDWYASVAAGAGDGAFYLPRYRIDAFINRKLLPGRDLVVSLGAGYYRAPDGHVDRNLTVGGHYYFPGGWVMQAAVRFNESDPGSVRATQKMVAITYAGQRRSQFVGRYGWGRESYLAIGPSESLVDFASREASLQWRFRIDARQGFTLSGEYYRNPLYRRSGVALGYFAELK